MGCLCQLSLQESIVWVTANHHIYRCKAQQVSVALHICLDCYDSTANLQLLVSTTFNREMSFRNAMERFKT